MVRERFNRWQKWLRPGIYIKRWLVVLALGLIIFGVGVAQLYIIVAEGRELSPLIQNLTLHFLPPLWRVVVAATIGICLFSIALYELNNSLVQPIVSQTPAHFVDMLSQHNRLQKGLRIVVIGGGTGLPSVLRGMKTVTNHVTAVVTMADDGGSSGRLRRELGIPPPGDLRNNLAALADDEDMMTRLFQYRFSQGDLGGHSFGNLFLTALSDITGNMEEAVGVASSVLAIRGRVLPSTLHNVNLGAEVLTDDGKRVRVHGESNIPTVRGKIERVFLEPSNVQVLPEVTRAILSADVIVIGPGSLYTSILPNLLVRGVVDALKVSTAKTVYICNIAQQPGETDDYTVAEHVEAIEKHIGRDVIDLVLANTVQRSNPYNTEYVELAPQDHPIYTRYKIIMTDLADPDRPWRHDPEKLVKELLKIGAFEAPVKNLNRKQPS